MKKSDWLDIVLDVVIAILICLIVVNVLTFRNPPEPEQCALCGYEDSPPLYLAPAIINLATGNICELQMYQLNPFDRSKLALVQQTGAFRQLNFDGATAYINLGEDCHVLMTEDAKRIDYSLYCRDCRKLLSKAATRGCVLLDLHDFNNIRAYPVTLGAEYEINDYTVSVRTGKIYLLPEGEDECTEIVVTGPLTK